MTKVSIIIPTLNEEDSLSVLLKELSRFNEDIYEIIIVDGQSSDDTIKIAKKFKCKIIIQERKLGYGDAIINGINEANSDYSIILDGDGSKNPIYIKDLIEKIINSNSDFVFAERYGQGAGSLDDTLLTHFGNRIFTLIGKIFFGLNLNDILHTFFICKNDKFKYINFKFNDFGFCVELPIKVHKSKFKYTSIPTIERRRIAGEIKVRSFVDGYKILISMLKLFTNINKNI